MQFHDTTLLAIEGLALAIAAFALFKVMLNSLVFIPNESYGMVERKWGSAGRNTFAPITLDKGAGFLPGVLSGGWHLLMPFQYRVHKHRRITIDGIAYIIARVGASLEEGQALGHWPEGVPLEDARSFLESGGQRGPQRRIIRAGTYAPNLALFCIITDREIHSLAIGNTEDDAAMQRLLTERRGFEPVVIANDTIGIITIQDGPSLQHGEIVAPTVGTDPAQPDTFHNSFQDIPRFLAAKGRRGRQEQVLVDGTYWINALFATVESKPKTKVPIGYVAVANSYVGSENQEALSADNGRGRTAKVGYKGIWERPFEPGKYPLNTYAMEVELVPTTNFQLKWIAGVTSGPADTSFDSDLREIPVITSDAFEILLPLSIVAHISPMNAPHVIQRFSNIQRFVGQTLDPLVSAYFKDATQSRNFLTFIRERKDIQTEALQAMQARLKEHRIDIQEVLLGTPKSPPGDDRVERMLSQLRERQIADEQRQTYTQQVFAQNERTKLAAAEAQADQQPDVTKSELSIRIAKNAGDAEVARQTALAQGIRVTADAEAHAAKARSDALGGTEALIRQLAIEAVVTMARDTKVPLVPSVMIEGGDGQQGGLLGTLLATIAARPLVQSAGYVNGEDPGRALS